MSWQSRSCRQPSLNAATSATGRAVSIAAAGLAPSDWTKKATREEMEKVERRGGSPAGGGGGDAITDGQIRAIGAISRSMKRTIPNTDGWMKRQASEYIDRLKKVQESSETEVHDEEPF